MDSVPSARQSAASQTPATAEETKGEIVGGGDSAKIVAHIQQTHWVGPLPSPDSFNKYPESAQNRILTIAEDESTHRRALQNKTADAGIAAKDKSLSATIDRDRRGQMYTFILVVFVVAASTFLVWSGHTWGLSILIVGIVAALNPFIEKLKELFSSGKKEPQ